MIDQKNSKLGKGLSSLISGKSFSRSGKSSIIDKFNAELKIGLTKIVPNPKQPRKNFEIRELENLASSIREKGIIQPIIVRKTSSEEKYEIIAGERRWRAAQIAGMHEIPVIIKDLSDHEVLEISIIENVQRENLTPVEEANAYSALIKEFSYSQEQLSKKIGKSRSYIANIIRLLDLPEYVLELLKNGKLTVGHARPLIGINNATELAKIIVEKKLSVRQTEKLVSGKKNITSKTSKKLIDPNIKDLETELSEKIGLRTSINFNDKSTSGSITVYYSNLDQLDDIMRRLKK